MSKPLLSRFDLGDPSTQRKASPPVSQTPTASNGQGERAGSSHSESSHDEELTAEDIRYLKADHIWGDMGRGGL